jgi:FixJ family two-component response regulator
MATQSNSNPAPVIFIVDDDESVLQGLARMLRIEGFETRAWTSVYDFFDEHEPDAPGCLITDILMPTMNGLDLQRTLRRGGSERPIIFITGHSDIPMTVRAMKAGAISLLTKPVRRVQLVAAVQEALAEDAAIRAIEHERRAVRKKIQSLTPREHEVLHLVAKGLLNKQIAAALGTSEKTIKVHRGRLMRKMQVRSAAALVSVLARLGANVRWDADLTLWPFNVNVAQAQAHQAPSADGDTAPQPRRSETRLVPAAPEFPSVQDIATERLVDGRWHQQTGLV